jgi:hypothetical protein
VHQGEHGSVELDEQPMYSDTVALGGKVLFVGGACLLIGGMVAKNDSATLLGIFSGIVGSVFSVDYYIKKIRRYFWGPMIILSKEGIYYWNWEKCVPWEDIEDVTLEEKTAYVFSGTTFSPRFGRSSLAHTTGSMVPRTRNYLRLIEKDNGVFPDSPFESLKRTDEKSNKVIPLRNLPISQESLIKHINKYRNKYKAKSA